MSSIIPFFRNSFQFSRIYFWKSNSRHLTSFYQNFPEEIIIQEKERQEAQEELNIIKRNINQQEREIQKLRQEMREELKKQNQILEELSKSQ